MPVFVHGVLDTHRLWGEVRKHLQPQDVIAVDLPGFSSPILAGFGCTANDYATWLLTQVERIRREHGSVDLQCFNFLSQKCAGARCP